MTNHRYFPSREASVSRDLGQSYTFLSPCELFSTPSQNCTCTLLLFNSFYCHNSSHITSLYLLENFFNVIVIIIYFAICICFCLFHFDFINFNFGVGKFRLIPFMFTGTWHFFVKIGKEGIVLQFIFGSHRNLKLRHCKSCSKFYRQFRKGER